MPDRSTEDWLALFTESALREQQVSASTLEAYTLDLAMLSRWATGQARHLLEITTADLARYVDERRANGIRLSTLARHLSSFRRFYAFLIGHGAIGVNPAAAVVVSQPVRQASGPVCGDVVRRLLQPPRGPFPTPAAAYRAQRDHAIVCTLSYTALGISDVRLLRWQEIDANWDVIRLPLHNGEHRSVVLDGALTAVLRRLHEAVALNEFPEERSAYCFPTSSGLPMSRQSLCHIVRKWASTCGQERVITPSALRRAGQAYQLGRHKSRSVPAEASVRKRTDGFPASRDDGQWATIRIAPARFAPKSRN